MLETTRQKKMILYDRAVSLDFRADTLPLDFNRSGDCQPHVTHHATVVPPVVPGVLRGFLAHGVSRNRLLRNAIVNFYGKIIRGLKMRSDVQRICGVPTLVMTNFHTVQPYAGGVKGRSEVQLNVSTV